jgi:hypothetical protein
MQVSRKMLVGMVAAAISTAACGSKSDDSGGATATVGTDFSLVFSPMYSAYDNGAHMFQVPVVPQGGITVDKWEITDAKGVVQKDVADFTPEPAFGGAMITTRKAGDYKVVAIAGKQSGSADIHITQAGPDDWMTGEMRYNNTIMLTSLIPMGGTQGMTIPKDPSCSNCHGDGASFLAVQHTPQQTGGYSDDDLKKIITMGMKPAGSMSKTGIPLALYQYFHTWTATDAEQQGLVIYLRSLTPKTQGALDFNGLMPPGGGMMTGAAGSAPTDTAGSSSDAAGAGGM